MKTLCQDVNDPRRDPLTRPASAGECADAGHPPPKWERAMLSHGLLLRRGFVGARVVGLREKVQKPSRVAIPSSLREGSACAPALPGGALQHCGWVVPGARLGDVAAAIVC